MGVCVCPTRRPPSLSGANQAPVHTYMPERTRLQKAGFRKPDSYSQDLCNLAPTNQPTNQTTKQPANKEPRQPARQPKPSKPTPGNQPATKCWAPGPGRPGRVHGVSADLLGLLQEHQGLLKAKAIAGSFVFKLPPVSREKRLKLGSLFSSASRMQISLPLELELKGCPFTPMAGIFRKALEHARAGILFQVRTVKHGPASHLEHWKARFFGGGRCLWVGSVRARACVPRVPRALC